MEFRIVCCWLGLLAGVFVTGCEKKAGSAAGGGGGPGVVRVVVVPVRNQSVTETVPLIGSIAANEIVTVRSETEGVVVAIGFEEGQRVEKGQLLVGLDESKFAAGLTEAEANLKLSRATYDRASVLLGERLISPQEYDQTAATLAANEAGVTLRRRLARDARIMAPFNGIAGARLVSPGQVIDRNSEITTLVDLDPVRVEIRVPERYMSQMVEGQKVRFRVDAFPDKMFEGDVYFISPELDINTRTALIKAMVPNPKIELRAGMFAKLELTVRLGESAMVVPEPALVYSGDQVTVFTVGSETNAVVRPVVVGLRMAGMAEILSGLEPGEMVVVEGVQKLFPGAPLKLAPDERSRVYLESMESRTLTR